MVITCRPGSHGVWVRGLCSCARLGNGTLVLLLHQWPRGGSRLGLWPQCFAGFLSSNKYFNQVISHVIMFYMALLTIITPKWLYLFTSLLFLHWKQWHCLRAFFASGSESQARLLLCMVLWTGLSSGLALEVYEFTLFPHWRLPVSWNPLLFLWFIWHPSQYLMHTEVLNRSLL